MSRDRDGIDGRTLKRKIREVGGIILTRDRTYDFRNRVDSCMFDMESMVAGWDWEEIHQATWDGILKRAALEPMLRRRPMVGYKLDIVGYRKDGVHTRLPKKNKEDAKLISENWHRLVTTRPGVLARELNSEGKLRPVRKSNGELVAWRQWFPSDITRIMGCKLYIGIVEFGANAKSDLVASYRAKHGSLVHMVPELAYVSPTICFVVCFVVLNVEVLCGLHTDIKKATFSIIAPRQAGEVVEQTQ